MQILLALQVIQPGAQAAELLIRYFMRPIHTDQVRFRRGPEWNHFAAGEKIAPVDVGLLLVGSRQAIGAESAVGNVYGGLSSLDSGFVGDHQRHRIAVGRGARVAARFEQLLRPPKRVVNPAHAGSLSTFFSQVFISLDRNESRPDDAGPG